MQQKVDFTHIWSHIEREDREIKHSQIERMWQEYNEWKIREGIALTMQTEEEIHMFHVWKSTLRRFKQEIFLILIHVETKFPPKDTLVLFPVIRTKKLNRDTLEYE